MSNTIYSAILPVISQDKNKFNYVYQITEISTGIKYIGSRGSEKLPALEDLKKYKSSTKDIQFELNQINNPLNYWYEILSYHSTRDEATLEESRLHFLYDVKCNPGYYNRSNQTANGFSVAGRVTVKDKNGKTSSVTIDDPRYLSGELVPTLLGRVIVKDKDGNTMQVDINDPRYLSGELNSISANKVMVKDKYGNIFQTDINNDRYLSGELVHILADKIAVKDKDGNKYQVDKNDPRYLSGELVGIGKGSIVVQDKHGNMSRVSVDDPRYLSGELFSPCKGKIMINNGIQSKYINKDDEIPVGWSIGSKPTKKKGKSGSENVSAKKVSIHGKIYNCIKDAFTDLDITRAVLDRRLKSNKPEWADWKYV